MNWIYFALMTVACWGLYGIFLHSGIMGMDDNVNGRYKAFLFVGIAYFFVAVLAPAIMLYFSEADARWSFPAKGMWWSLIAGIVGAVGAFGVLLAFGAKGSPSVVMAIIFAGAPIVNAIVFLSLHPPKGGWGSIPIPFYLGIVLAALGGCLVTLYKPVPTNPAAQATEAHADP